MIADAFLRLTTEAGQRPMPVGNTAVFQPAPFPLGYIGADTRSIDIGALMDLGAGRHNLKARFTVTENFNIVGTPPGGWRGLFVIMVGTNADLSTGAQVLSTKGPMDGINEGFSVGQLLAGRTFELPLPPLDSLVRDGVDGFKYLGLFLAHQAPTSNDQLNAGLVRAQFMLDTEQEIAGGHRYHASGFDVQ